MGILAAKQAVGNSTRKEVSLKSQAQKQTRRNLFLIKIDQRHQK